MPLLLTVGCRYGYGLLTMSEKGAAVAGNSGDGSGGALGAGAVTNGAGENGASLGGGGSLNTGGTLGTAGDPGSGGASGDGTSATGSGGAGRASGGTSGTATGGMSSGGSNSSGGTTSGGSAGASGGSGGTSALGGSSGSGGSGTGGGGTAPDLMDGYWTLTASDTGGKNWTPSTLLFTSALTNSDGTVSLDYRIDWFENAGGSFGVLLGGEEYGVGTYDPALAHLVLNQTSGFASDTLDQYEADYDAPTQAFVNGFWNTGTPGTFTGAHTLSGHDVVPLTASATSARGALPASNAVDIDMLTYWSSANGKTIGESLTLTLPGPTNLEGFRLISYSTSTDSAPSRVLVHCFDDVGTEISATDVVLPSDPAWKPVALAVSSVSSVEVEVTEISPAGGNRVVVYGVEVFGLP